MSRQRSSISVLPVLAVLALLGATAGAAQAQQGKQTYYFLVHELKVAAGISDEVASQVRAQITRAIDSHERLIGALPADAPDPAAEPAAFETYVKRNKLRPFRLNVEVLEYRHELEPVPAPRQGQRLTVSISLRMFGETMPQRVMAFTGEGSSTIKLDIGKTLRPRDSQVGNREAMTLAVNDALATSITRLEAKDKPAPRKKRRGKK